MIDQNELLQCNDDIVKTTSVFNFTKVASTTGYLFFYERTESSSSSSVNTELYFTVNNKEEELIKHLWAAIDDKNMHSVAVRDDRTNDFLTHDQLAMINSMPKQST